MRLHLLYVLPVAAALAGCLVGPDYQRPATSLPIAFKEADGWVPAQPSDAAERADWWTVFGDPVLDDLQRQVKVSNQNLAAAEAAYRQATALVSEQRAALFPAVTLGGSAGVSGGGAAASNTAGNPAGGSGTATSGGGTSQSYHLSLGATWAPDVWGRIRRTVENAHANAQASAADLATATLSAQSELALDYIGLRQLDEDKRLLDATAQDYRRSLDVAQNRYNAGVAARSDVLAAQAQLATAQGDAVDLEQQRARLEHAIAILAGRPPADLTLPAAPWTLNIPDIPASVPSLILQRRPDIAAAERRAAAASAEIGVQTSAYYPDLTLTGSTGFAASELAGLLSAPANVWSLGVSVAQTLLDAGATRSRVRQARAAYDQAVAQYRQTVLTALGQVEDNLAAQRVLIAEQAYRRVALTAAVENQRIVQNQYRAGQVDYTSVVVANATAYNTQRTELQLEASRLTAVVDLIAAMGGGSRWAPSSSSPSP